MWGFTPKWVRMLPEHLRPDSAKIRALEDLRKRYEIPHEMLAVGIGQSEHSTLRTQRLVLDQSRARMPANASEKDLWACVLTSRAESAVLAGNKPMDADAIMRILENAKSFDDICEAIINYERSQRVPDLSGIQDEIDALLTGRFSLIVCSRCSYEFPLLQGGFLQGMLATCPKCSYEFVPNSTNFRATPKEKQEKKNFDEWPPRKLPR